MTCPCRSDEAFDALTVHHLVRWLTETRWLAAGAIAVALLVVSCGDSVDSTVPDGAIDAYTDHLDAIDAAVTIWREASTLAGAQEAAEAAANLVVGPTGPGYGDRNGDGEVSGATTVGLLPGLDGTPTGPALSLADNACIEANVLGGSWDDPSGRWGEMEAAIEAWTPTRNTMPTLASHPMRVVGWATFTLGSTSRDEAREYAGHAQLHVDVSRSALDC